MYSLMWSMVVPLLLQSVAIWQKVLLPMYLCTGKVLLKIASTPSSAEFEC